VATALSSQTQTLNTIDASGGLQLSSSLPDGISFNLSSDTFRKALSRSVQANETLSIKRINWEQNRCVEARALTK
jgi:hypothetical protein